MTSSLVTTLRVVTQSRPLRGTGRTAERCRQATTQSVVTRTQRKREIRITMLPLFLYPLGFLGLLAVPALVAIYLLRNRFRRYPVSSLMLWLDAREAREGGTKLRRLQTPLLFLLELLAILLLVFAATDPQVRLTQGTRPLVVILDDSFSMVAGGPNAPRDQALQALGDELRRQMPYSVRFVLAGEKPQLLGETVRSAREAMRIASGWRCRAPGARLDEALALGAELGGELALLLVLTDHPPPRGADFEKGRVKWWSFGKARPNVAFVNAARTGREGRDRCLFEIANLSAEPTQTRLRIEPLEGGVAIHRAVVKFDAGGAQRITLTLPEGTPAVRAVIDNDDLPIDNAVTLQPPPARGVRALVRLLDRRIREPVEKAIRSARNATLTATRPEIIFTDTSVDAKPPEGAWVVRFDAEKEAVAYSGPFVMDRAHTVTDGLSLKGIIWGAGKEVSADGAAVVLAGNVPLITDVETATASGSRHELRIRFRPDLSTLQETPDWPILIWNILDWRAGALPGLTRTNVRLGEQVVLNLPTYRETVRLTPPGEGARTVPVRGRQVAFRAEEVGVYEVSDGDQKYAFAVNALEKDESDLLGCTEGRWGDWLDDTSLKLEYRGVAWLLLLLLLAVAVLHLLVMARPAQGGAGSS